MNTPKPDGSLNIDYRGNGAPNTQLYEIVEQTQLQTRFSKLKFKTDWGVMVGIVSGKTALTGVAIPKFTTIVKYLRKFREIFYWYLRSDLFYHNRHLTARSFTKIPKSYLCLGVNYKEVFINLEKFSYDLLGGLALRIITKNGVTSYEQFLSSKFAETIGRRTGVRLLPDQAATDVVLNANAATTNGAVPTESPPVKVLVLAMGDVISELSRLRCIGFSGDNPSEKKDIYTVTSCTDDSEATHVLKNHVPLCWSSAYFLPHLVRKISDATNTFQFNEIYIDNLVADAINMHSVLNVGHLFSVLLQDLEKMNMLSKTLKIVLPFHAAVVYEIHHNWSSLELLHLHVRYTGEDLGVRDLSAPASIQLPVIGQTYTNYAGGTLYDFIQKMSSLFTKKARIDTNQTWIECQKWLNSWATKFDAEQNSPFKYIVIEKKDDDANRSTSSVDLPFTVGDSDDDDGDDDKPGSEDGAGTAVENNDVNHSATVTAGNRVSVETVNTDNGGEDISAGDYGGDDDFAHVDDGDSQKTRHGSLDTTTPGVRRSLRNRNKPPDLPTNIPHHLAHFNKPPSERKKKKCTEKVAGLENTVEHGKKPRAMKPSSSAFFVKVNMEMTRKEFLNDIQSMYVSLKFPDSNLIDVMKVDVKSNYHISAATGEVRPGLQPQVISQKRKFDPVSDDTDSFAENST